MYVMDISYFSGKLECYFNFQVVSPLDSIAASLFVLNWLSWQIVRRLRQPPQEGVQDL